MDQNIHSALTSIASAYQSQQVVVVTTAEVSACRPEIGALPYPVLVLPGGEENKSLALVQRIWDFLLEHAVTRSGLLICIGGGVLTDIGGFAASTYKRGIDYVNVPTTLLAMVDASTGGKTGFNYGGLKNSIGTFCQPKQTIICPSLLDTLPANHLLSGLAEMFKTGLLDESLWNALLRYDIERMDIDQLTPLIADCVRVKEQIVKSDPQESGLRKALNFGHTFGHALEEISLSDTSSNGLLHGYAVLYGMIAELFLSVTLLGMPREPLQQLTQRTLQFYGRIQCSCKDRDRLISLMRQDKKNEHVGDINCTLLQAVGQPRINQIITPEQAAEAFDYLFSL